jgi:hypothetical protein
MTMARRVAILRERAADWPKFATMDLPGDLGVLPVEVHRTAMERMAVAVGRASSVLTAGLDRSVPAERAALWLLALSSPVPRARRLGVLMATRAGVWDALEKDGVAVPDGPRSEVPLNYTDADALGFGGSIRFPVSDLPIALEVARTQNAVVVATDPAAADPLRAIIGDSPQLDEGKAPNVFMRAVPFVVGGTVAFVATGFGWFDDVEVGSYVFGYDELLDPIEAALRDVVAELVEES